MDPFHRRGDGGCVGVQYELGRESVVGKQAYQDGWKCCDLVCDAHLCPSAAAVAASVCCLERGKLGSRALLGVTTGGSARSVPDKSMPYLGCVMRWTHRPSTAEAMKGMCC